MIILLNGTDLLRSSSQFDITVKQDLLEAEAEVIVAADQAVDAPGAAEVEGSEERGLTQELFLVVGIRIENRFETGDDEAAARKDRADAGRVAADRGGPGINQLK